MRAGWRRRGACGSRRRGDDASTMVSIRREAQEAMNKIKREPKIVRPDDVDPHHDWTGRSRRWAHGGRLRGAGRLSPPARLSAGAHAPGAGQFGPGRDAVLRPVQHPLHSRTVIGEWARDKLTRYALLAGDGEPYVWDFGSAAKHHQLYAPWLQHDHCRAGMLGLRGAIRPEGGLFRGAAEEIKSILRRGRRRRHAARRRRRRAADAVRVAGASGSRCAMPSR